jgi:predicted HTH transcriptional regulator
VLLGVSTRGAAPVIVGCPYDDSTELAIRQKASEADPPVRVELRAENIEHTPCVVVSIPQSPLRPHCSPRGRYLLRDGNKNRALKPAEMLGVFLEAQSGQFLERFRAAGEELASQFERVEHEVKHTGERIQGELKEIFQQAQAAGEIADEAMNSAGEASAGVEDLGPMALT